MSLLEFIENYGYLAVLIGSIFEGETILVLAGLAVQNGFLSLPPVFLSAFVGAIIGDWFFFFGGRYYGDKINRRFPLWDKLTERPTRLICARVELVALTMRFMYGFRHIVPFTLGRSRISISKFMMYNALGALSWSVIVGFLGFFAGEIVETWIGGIKRYEFKIIVVAVLLLALIRVLLTVFKLIMRYLDLKRKL